MALRFQRSIRIAPGLRLNISKRGFGVSVGGRGFHVGVNARGQRYTSVGLPGTGISYRTYQQRPAGAPSAPRPGSGLGLGILIVVGLVVLYVIGSLIRR